MIRASERLALFSVFYILLHINRLLVVICGHFLAIQLATTSLDVHFITNVFTNYTR